MPTQVACIWLPNWPCQRLSVCLGSELAQQPFALQARDPRRGLRIMAADPLARQNGIVPGMSASEACALLPNLRLLEYDPQEDLEAIIELAEQAWQFTPLVGLETLDEEPWAGRFLHQPQALLLDLTGLIDFFGGAANLLRFIQRWLTGKGYIGVTAIAESVGAAWALANYAGRREVSHRLLAMRSQPSIEPSSEWDGPQMIAHSTSHNAIENPVPWFDGNQRKAAIHRLPIEALRLDSKSVHTLHQLGIRSIESLSRLPRSGLASRLGHRLLERMDAVCEKEKEPIRCLKEVSDYSVEQTLEIPTHHRETIEEILRRLTAQLCHQLSRHGHGAIRLVCCLRLEQSPAWVVSLGLYRATADPTHLLPLLLGTLMQAESGRKQISYAAITSIALTATMTGPLIWKQTPLFEGESHRHRDSLVRLIDSLSGRLGRRQIVAPQIHRHPQPEWVCQWRPLTGQRPDGRPQSTHRKLPRTSSVEPSCEDPWRRPLQLWHPAQPLRIEAFSPAGLPSRWLFEGEIHCLVRSWGPERIESGWWLGASQRRDYYRVETDRGAWLWIYRDLKRNEWFLHGVF